MSKNESYSTHLAQHQLCCTHTNILESSQDTTNLSQINHTFHHTSCNHYLAQVSGTIS